MKHILVIILVLIGFTSCGSSKSKVVTTKPLPTTTTVNTKNKSATKIVSHAQQFIGTPYAFGGTTAKGMDCSGLIYVAFNSVDIKIPRTSRAMSFKGKRLYLKDVDTGDLLFFQTNKNRNVINHVGLVTKVLNSEIFFIHSSSSKGVMVSSFNLKYWKASFVMARRLL